MADLEETPPYSWNPLSKFCDREAGALRHRRRRALRAIVRQTMQNIDHRTQQQQLISSWRDWKHSSQ